MNKLIVKRTCAFSFLFGAILGIMAIVPFTSGLAFFILILFSSVIIILYMKKNEKHLGIINTEQGAILGGIIGFVATLGFCVTYLPMNFILSLIFTKSTDLGISYFFTTAPWLFFIMIFMTCFILGLTNSATGMGTAYILSYFEKKPEGYDAPLDIKIED